MSRQNVELVREFFGLFVAGDSGSWRQYFAPDVVWDTSQSRLPATGVYRGYEGIEQFFADWLPIWVYYAVETDEFIYAGDSVVVVFRQRGRGKGSGAHAERTFFGSYDL